MNIDECIDGLSDAEIKAMLNISEDWPNKKTCIGSLTDAEIEVLLKIRGEWQNKKMRIDELMAQKKRVDDLINGLVSKYGKGGGGYRIEKEMEHIVPGICGLPPDRECGMHADDGVRMLLFLIDEKKSMFDAVIKCQAEKKMRIAGVHECDFIMPENVGERIMRTIKKLYRKPAAGRETQKNDAFGYDVILTRKSRIDGELLDGIYGRLSRKLKTFRQEMEEIDSLETDYEPTVDYLQYHGNLEKCLCALKERWEIIEECITK